MAKEDTPLRSGRQWILWVGGLGVVLTAVLGIWYTIQDGEALEVRPEVGSLAPDFSLLTLNGATVRLSSLRGERAVLLNFWATWCPPCRLEMPTMQKAYNEYEGRGLEILAVSVDAGPKSAVQDFMGEFNLTFPALLDPEMEILRKYRTVSLPVTFLIDRRGVIRYKHIGYNDWTDPEARKRLEEILR
ncbi:MAG: peroxiredoxin family protein [Candidatus Methylomirabilales bacterium]